MSRVELAVRVGVLLFAGALAAASVGGWLLTPFGLAALASTADLAARAPDRGWPEWLLLGSGFLLVVAVLLGLVLNLVPGGLTPVSWAIGWVVVGLMTIAVRYRRPVPRPPIPSFEPRHTRFYAAAAVIVALSAGVALAGAQKDGNTPLELWVDSRTANSAVVAARSDTAVGPLVLEVVTDGPSWASPRLTLPPATTVTQTVPVAPGHRYTITLQDADSGALLRTVIIDGSLPPVTANGASSRNHR